MAAVFDFLSASLVEAACDSPAGVTTVVCPSVTTTWSWVCEEVPVVDEPELSEPPDVTEGSSEPSTR